MKKVMYTFPAKVVASFLGFIFCALAVSMAIGVTYLTTSGILLSSNYFETDTFQNYLRADMQTKALELVDNKLRLVNKSTYSNAYYVFYSDGQVLDYRLEGNILIAKPDDGLTYLKQIGVGKTYSFSFGMSYMDENGEAQSITVNCYAAVDPGLSYDDIYAQEAREFLAYKEYETELLIFVIPVIIFFILILSYLIRTTGFTSADQKEVKLAFQDRIYGDLFTLAFIGLGAIFMSFEFGMAWEFPRVLINLSLMYGFPIYFICLIWLLSMVRRYKAGTLFSATLIAKIFFFFVRIIRSVFGAVSDTINNINLFIKVLGALAVVILGNGLLFILADQSAFFVLVLLGFNAFVVLYVFQIARSLKRITYVAAAIAQGDLKAKVSMDTIAGSLKSHGEIINHIGNGIDAAVNEKIKSEKFKTELIANVSHDIKTPLTSIINYVDLVKKLDIEDDKLKEYMETLERNAFRLKVLTEDLVDLSKATTGNLQIQAENLNFNELVLQGAGEYEEKLEERGIQIILDLPSPELYIYADGRLMWRIVENLFTNVRKYAFSHSRVYCELKKEGEQVVWIMKNISARPLNMTAEALMERFVRGDTARNTEGSGLGLSIAKSLTEILGGNFSIQIDGDLFKSLVRFPLVTPSAQPPSTELELVPLD